MAKIVRPVVLIPGLAGSRIKTKERPTYRDNLWMSLEMLQLLPKDQSNQQSEEVSQQSAPSVVGFNVPEYEIKAEETPDPGAEWKRHMKVNVYVGENNIIDGVTPLVEVEEPELGADGEPNQYNKPVEGLEGIENFLPNIPFTEYNTRYYEELVYTLTREYKNLLGQTKSDYRKNENVVGAPYDWRIAPGGLQVRYSYFTKLKKKIEQLYEDSGSSLLDRERVVIIAQSMGNRVTQYFLQWVKNIRARDGKEWGQEWIDKYIFRYIAVSPPWLGAPMSIRMLVTDDGLKIGTAALSGMKEVIQSYSSVPWLLPVTQEHYQYFNTQHFGFLKKGSGQTTDDFAAIDIKTTLEKGGANSTLAYLEKFYQTNPLITQAEGEFGDKLVGCPPVKNLSVIYSTGFPTAVGAYYEEVDGGLKVADYLGKDEKLEDGEFIIRNGVRVETSDTLQTIDNERNCGDGIVPYGSLTYFKEWQKDPEITAKTNIKGYAFQGGVSSHSEILRDPRVITRILILIGLLEPPKGEEI
ncbi:lipase/acyltransferase domain-containing protein [Nostoc sp. CCY 9925]|uniref:lipase/acyltransferase domain-containing protein n=1 Tax=Nostoc sp. CCY 9925 TaxID=3103865 RepID=UPI0039C5F756